MDSRKTKNTQVPKQVAKLMRREKVRAMREDFCSCIEEQLCELGLNHWGLSLEKKMEKYPEVAWNALEYWSLKYGIDYTELRQKTPWYTFCYVLQTVR